MKTYTGIEQSKKLAEILPVGSAGAFYCGDGRIKMMWEHLKDVAISSPCWSLAALLQITPDCIEDKYWLELGKLNGNSGWYVCYESYDLSLKHYIAKSNLIDACVEMILKLNEEKLL